MDKRPIGFMDSGIGGLTVFDQVFKKLPNEDYIYIGDQKNLPYGEKSSELVCQLTTRIAKYEETLGIKMMVIGCNTATAASLDYLQKELTIPVIGVIDAGAELGVDTTRNHKIAVIATNGTVKSGRYERKLKELLPDAEVISKGIPDFVTLVEDGHAKDADTPAKVAAELASFDGSGIDTMIMGCTHFPIIRDAIQQAVGPDVKLVDPGIGAAKAVDKYLGDHDMYNDQAQGTQKFMSTGDAKAFEDHAGTFLSYPITVSHIDL